MIWIYIDDERTIDGPDEIARDYKSAIAAIDMYYSMVSDKTNVIVVDFDHDLGEKRSGYDVAKYIVENQLSTNRIVFKLHTMNPIGRFNIKQLLTHYGYQEIGEWL